MLHRRGGSALCGDEWLLNGLNQRSTQWDFLFNSNIERKIIFSRTRQICFKHLLAIMNDGHYFMNCRLIVWQDGEDVWNKLWNFEPGVCALAPAPGELRRRWGGDICRPPASCDKHRKLKYLNCELKFSFWKSDVDYYISLRNISLSFLESRQPESPEIIREPFLSLDFLLVPGPASGWHPHLSTEQTPGQEIMPSCSTLYSFHFRERAWYKRY